MVEASRLGWVFTVKKIFCDKCENEIHKFEWYKITTCKAFSNNEMGIDPTYKERDLCGECFNKLGWVK